MPLREGFVMLDVDLSRREVEAVLRKTMAGVGYNKAIAGVGAWSAVWLEERYQSGITQLIVYLSLINGRDIDDLSPRIHPEFGIAGGCPFMLAEAIIELSDKWIPRGGVTFGAPAEPFLMMASIADWASTRSQSVRFRHFNYSCLMSNAGVEIETNDLSMVGWVDPDSDQPIMVELTNDHPRPSFNKLNTLKLPRARFRGRNALDLG